jgi:hypothetical protein
LSASINGSPVTNSPQGKDRVHPDRIVIIIRARMGLKLAVKNPEKNKQAHMCARHNVFL